MTPDGSFVDLRLNRQEGQNQESFWPSFTDIMTVVVMIFVIAMVVLLLRNIELVKQLRATMEAEREAMELARTTGEEKESLALKLFQAENDLSMLRIRLMQLEEQREAQASTIDLQHQDIAKLQSEKEALELLREQLSAENYVMQEKLKKQGEIIQQQKADLKQIQDVILEAQRQIALFQEEIVSTRSELKNLQQAHEAVQEQLARMRTRYTTQTEELLATQIQERQTGRQLSELRSDYETLQAKYEKLIRPARTPAGRYLVEVRATKQDGQMRIEYQTPDKPGYEPVSRARLEQILTRLKSEQPGGLYIRMIFPEDSGLTFNEAWRFTAELHGRYDYYFQGGGPQLVPVLPPLESNR